MQRKKKSVATIACVVVALGMVTWFVTSFDKFEIARMLLPDLTGVDLYPAAPSMAPVVSASMDELLAEYEAFLAKDAPKVLEALQPGLTHDEILQLEAKYQVTLTQDLRELYQWRNGSVSELSPNAFPYMWFVPIDTALEARAFNAKELEQLDPQRREFYDEVISHTYPWIGIILDPGGEGYHYDPERAESEGSFFHHDTGEYTFYPSVRNYLAEVLEEIRAGGIYATDTGLAYKL